MKNDRTHNSAKNVLFGIINQIVIVVLGFLSRSIFIYFLDEYYLGINGLFTELLSALSLADLGLNSVMIYNYYKPLADDDTQKIIKLNTFYSYVYKIISLAVFVIGLCLVPFLNNIVNFDKQVDNLYLFYFLFLIKTVVSYLFVYRIALLYASQKEYIVSRINSVIKILTTVTQVVFLYFFHSFWIYLIVDIISILLTNIICAIKVKQLYTFIDNKSKLENEERKKIVEDIKSGFIYKLSSVLLNSTDNTIISIMIGTVMVGMYSNYSLIISKLSQFITVFFGALNGSVGNLIAVENEEKKYEVFNVMQMVCFLLSSISSICIFCLIQDFIVIWIGEKFVLSKLVLISCVCNFYFSVCLQALWTFREGAGLFKKTKFVMIYTAVLNLILSVVLGKIIGLAGILFASVLSRLLTYFWYEPLLLFGQYFRKSTKRYFLSHIYNAFITVLISFCIDHYLMNQLVAFNFMIKASIICAISVILCVLLWMPFKNARFSIASILLRIKNLII